MKICSQFKKYSRLGLGSEQPREQELVLGQIRSNKILPKWESSHFLQVCSWDGPSLNAGLQSPAEGQFELC